jgi:hypothetical protein
MSEIIEAIVVPVNTAQIAMDIANDQLQAEAQVAKAIARQALLEKLGITEEEAQLLLGGI